MLYNHKQSTLSPSGRRREKAENEFHVKASSVDGAPKAEVRRFSLFWSVFHITGLNGEISYRQFKKTYKTGR